MKRTLILILPILILLAACKRDNGLNVVAIPTAAPTHLSSVGSVPDTPIAAGEATPELEQTAAAAAIALPDPGGVSIACEQNTLRLPLSAPDGTRFYALTAIDVYLEQIYLIADGGLYRASRESLEAAAPALETIFAPGESIGGRPIQELSALAVDEHYGQVFVLDKAGHVFLYEIATGGKSLIFRSKFYDEEDEDKDANPVDPQLVGLTVDEAGQPVMLDTSRGALEIPGDLISHLAPINQSRSLIEGVDVVRIESNYYVLLAGGEIVTTNGSLGATVWNQGETRVLSLNLLVSDHLGLDILYVVDGLRREITGLVPADGRLVTHIGFDFPKMGLLRDVAFSGERWFALADNDLYLYPAPTVSGQCRSTEDATTRRPLIDGVDVLYLLGGQSTFPLEGDWSLPPWPRVYPGAARLYRSGVHQGIDFYSYTGPRGFTVGWSVLALAGGTVTRSTVIYPGLEDLAEFEALMASSDTQGYTDEETLDRLMGKHIIIDHGNGILSKYAHLDEITPGIVTGAQVAMGQDIGTVGVTGTQGEVERGSVEPHLHFELWVGDHYLGYGMRIREAMWWLSQLFPEAG